jgi:putative DNA primase/helicase
VTDTAGVRFAPLDIPEQHEAPPDISALRIGGAFGEMGHAAGEAVQMHGSIATLVTLAVVATCVQRAVDLEVLPGWREPLSLWSWGLADSGARKTHLLAPMQAPIAAWQKQMRDRYRSKVAAVRAQRDVAESRIERLKRDAANAKTPEDRAAAQRGIEQEYELMPEPVFAPRAFTENITAERLVSLFAENRERMAFWSDEGGQFGILAGLYSGGAANLDAFLKGFDGSPLVTDRQSAAHFVERPAFSMCVLLQPGVFSDALKNQRFRHSGLLARALYAFPESNIGRRQTDDGRAIGEAVRSAYDRQVFALLDATAEHRGPPRSIRFDADARASFRDFRAMNEADMAPDGRLAGLLDWGSKLPGKVARIAGLIEIANSGIDAEAVTGPSLRSAWQIAELLIPHARGVFFGLGGSREHEGPRALLDWLRAREWGGALQFQQRDAHRALEHRFRTAADVRTAAAVLTRWGVLSGPITVRNKAAPPSTAWAINPEALA